MNNKVNETPTPEGYTSLRVLSNKIKSYRIELAFERGNVTSHHKALVTNVTFPAEMLEGKEIKPVEAKGKAPAYGFVRVENANIHFRNGAKPQPDGSFVGRIEVKVKDQTKGDDEEIYFHLNLFPLPVGEKPHYEATIDRIVQIPEKDSVHFGPTIGTRKEVYLHLNPIAQ
ncbi:MAG: hypothetical protein KAQ64_01250 [Candidatus Pacebacteria bacterium]|nr:hypothetical protein [Candidatus Paceibacterota bacterium]